MVTPYEPETLMALPTFVKVPLALEPRVVIAVMQTTMIRASMTAYSTAVGPSSRFRNSTANCVNLRMSLIPFAWTQKILQTGDSQPNPPLPHPTLPSPPPPPHYPP